jgi:DtxR family Mn-dependent transcriptional regulator
MNSLAEENYLKAIYKLSERTGEDVYTNDIAKRLHTSAASVSDMLKKLHKKGLVNYEKYKGISLTDLGKKKALNIIRKHRLWEMFLVQVLEFKWNEVHEVAEQLEHIQSDKLIQHIDKALKYPKFDPHGDPIPDKNGKFILKEKPFLLSEGKMSQSYVVSGVIDHSDSFLHLLDELDISLGSKINILEQRVYDQSLLVQIHPKKKLFISNQIAKNLLVSHGKIK